MSRQPEPELHQLYYLQCAYKSYTYTNNKQIALVAVDKSPDALVGSIIEADPGADLSITKLIAGLQQVGELVGGAERRQLTSERRTALDSRGVGDGLVPREVRWRSAVKEIVGIASTFPIGWAVAGWAVLCGIRVAVAAAAPAAPAQQDTILQRKVLVLNALPVGTCGAARLGGVPIRVWAIGKCAPS